MIVMLNEFELKREIKAVKKLKQKGEKFIGYTLTISDTSVRLVGTFEDTLGMSACRSIILA